MNRENYKGRRRYLDPEEVKPKWPCSIACHRHKPRTKFLTQKFAFIRPYWLKMTSSQILFLDPTGSEEVLGEMVVEQILKLYQHVIINSTPTQCGPRVTLFPVGDSFTHIFQTSAELAWIVVHSLPIWRTELQKHWECDRSEVVVRFAHTRDGNLSFSSETWPLSEQAF